MHLELVCSNISSEEIVQAQVKDTGWERVVDRMPSVSHKPTLIYRYPGTLKRCGIILLQLSDQSICLIKEVIWKEVKDPNPV
jgi:hypothetical protein